MSEHSAQSSEQPDARISISVSTDRTHDLQSAVDKLNPILQEIVHARNSVKGGEAEAAPMAPIGFGRVHFSRSWSSP